MPNAFKRRFGAYEGEFEIPGSFFDPLPAEELAAFEGIGAEAEEPEHPPGVVKASSPRRSVTKRARKKPLK